MNAGNPCIVTENKLFKGFTQGNCSFIIGENVPERVRVMDKRKVLVVAIFLGVVAGAAPDEGRAFGSGRMELSVGAGVTHFNGDHPRLGFACTGAAFYGSFAYLPVPYVAPYAYGMTTFGKADTKPWEQGGYPEPAYFIGFSTWQVGGGARVRVGIFGKRVWPYAGAGFAFVWFARDALTYDELVMDSWGGASVGNFGEGGFDFYVRGDGFAAISVGYRYLRLPAAYDPAPGDYSEGFTVKGSLYSACLRLYFM